MRLLIVGGVAGGASAAARARRNREDIEIILFEKGDYVSFANCGLPYHIGNVIKNRENLIVMTSASFKKRANIEVRISNEVIKVNPEKKEIKVKDLINGKIYTEAYDKLILSPGSTPFIPDIPGINDPEVDFLWNIPHMDRIIAKIQSGAKDAVVVGGGFIGVELAENLAERHLNTTIIEKMDQLLPPFDKEMVHPIHETMVLKHVNVLLETAVTSVTKTENKKFLLATDKGEQILTDIVVFSIGVRPNTSFLKDSGIKLNSRGGIIVDNYMESSIPGIFAVGDAIEVKDLVTGKAAMIPLAGPANKQGRIAADNALGAKEQYKGSIGTAICKVFDMTAACTGASEKKLQTEKIDYFKYYIVPGSNASYYPGSERMFIKMLADYKGKILGAQIVGGKGVDKRIDLLSVAIRNELSLSHLEEMELAYAPPYASAKDPINFAGFVGVNILSGNSQVVYSDNIPTDSFLLDVREEDEFIAGSIPGAINIPLGKLRKNLDNIPKDKEIVAFCRVGLRGYVAERILKNNAFKAKNLSGGYEIWKLYQDIDMNMIKENRVKLGEVFKSETEENMLSEFDKEIDVCSLQCPGPVLKVKEALSSLSEGCILKVLASDEGFLRDLPSWCGSTGNILMSIIKKGGIIEAFVKKTTKQCTAGKEDISVSTKTKKSAIILFSNDLDKSLAAMIIAIGFASLGHEITVFFTFWGLNVLRKNNPPKVHKDLLSKMFTFMMPRGARKLALSKMHMAGIGTSMMKHVMKKKNVGSLPDLMSQAQQMGVKFLACDMAMNVMGIKLEELIDGVEVAGVANFAALSEQSSTTLFI